MDFLFQNTNKKQEHSLQQNKCIQVRKETDKDMKEDMKEDMTINMLLPFSTNMKYSLVLKWSITKKALECPTNRPLVQSFQCLFKAQRLLL
jgi:hypothetical protein